METTNTQKTFLRKGAALEFRPLKISEGEKRFVQVISSKVGEIFVKSQGTNVPAINVRDLETNLEHTLWLSGKLLTTAKMLQLTETLKDKKLEISNVGTEPVEMADGITYDMNNYEVYELQ